MAEELLSAYEGLSDAYEAGRNREFYLSVMDPLLDGLAAPRAGRALDLACGTGISTEALVSRYPALEWTAVDASPAMLARARAKPALAAVRWAQGFAERLPFEDARFEWINSSFALHWFRAEALTEIRRALRPGGLLTLTVPLRATGASLEGNRALVRSLYRRRPESRASQGFRLETLVERLRGWEVLRVESHRLVERYASGQELAQTLWSRGSWQAIFGADQRPELEVPGPVEFEWRVGLVRAIRA